jgi:hypothetical protein
MYGIGMYQQTREAALIVSSDVAIKGNLLDVPALTEVESTRYHAAALRSVNSRMGVLGRYNTDGVVAAIIGFAFHMVGLLELRGPGRRSCLR